MLKWIVGVFYTSETLLSSFDHFVKILTTKTLHVLCVNEALKPQECSQRRTVEKQDGVENSFVGTNYLILLFWMKIFIVRTRSCRHWHSVCLNSPVYRRRYGSKTSKSWINANLCRKPLVSRFYCLFSIFIIDGRSCRKSLWWDDFIKFWQHVVCKLVINSALSSAVEGSIEVNKEKENNDWHLEWKFRQGRRQRHHFEWLDLFPVEMAIVSWGQNYGHMVSCYVI